MKRFREDFESEKGGEREKPNLPKFSIRNVLVEDLNIKTDEGSDIWVHKMTFSFSMGGKRINLKWINLNSIDIPPEVFIGEAIGNLDFDFDTLRLFFLNLSGNVDTFNLKLKDLSIRIPEPSDSPTLFINVSRVDIGDMGAKGLDLKWVFTEKSGKIEFRADSLWYSETFLKNTSGTLDLQGYPEIFVNAVGKIFGGDFEFSVVVDSLQNVLGFAKFFDVSPTPNVKLTGRANFEVKEGIRVFGYISKLLHQEPDIVLENFDFDVKSSDFKVYSYRVYNNFMSINGWYNLSREDFYARFSLSKPTKLVKFQNIRVFTFEGEGEVIKEGEEINLKVTKGKAWYVVFDTLRIDEIEAENLYLKSNIYNPTLTNTYLLGKVFLKVTHPDTFSLIGDLSFEDGKVLSNLYFESIKFGRAYAKIRGNIPDTNSVDLIFDTLNYGFNDLSVRLLNLRFFLDSLRIGISIPQKGKCVWMGSS